MTNPDLYFILLDFYETDLLIKFIFTAMEALEYGVGLLKTVKYRHNIN